MSLKNNTENLNGKNNQAELVQNKNKKPRRRENTEYIERMNTLVKLFKANSLKENNIKD